MNERIIEKEEANKDSQFSVVDINSVCMFMKMWISTYFVFFQKKQTQISMRKWILIGLMYISIEGITVTSLPIKFYFPIDWELVVLDT